MAALTTREESRQRLLALFQASLDRIIPADESVPLRGQSFRDFEDSGRGIASDDLAGVAGGAGWTGEDGSCRIAGPLSAVFFGASLAVPKTRAA